MATTVLSSCSTCREITCWEETHKTRVEKIAGEKVDGIQRLWAVI